MAVTTEPARPAVSAAAEEQRVVVRVDSLLQLVGLLLRQTAVVEASSTRFFSACFSASDSSEGSTPSCEAASSMTALLSSLGENMPRGGDRARGAESGDEERSCRRHRLRT